MQQVPSNSICRFHPAFLINYILPFQRVLQYRGGDKEIGYFLVLSNQLYYQGTEVEYCTLVYHGVPWHTVAHVCHDFVEH